MSMIHANVPLVNKNIYIWFVTPICFATPKLYFATQMGSRPIVWEALGYRTFTFLTKTAFLQWNAKFGICGVSAFLSLAILSHQLHQWLVISNNVGCTAVATVCIFHQTSIPSCIEMRSSQYVVNLVVLKFSNIIITNLLICIETERLYLDAAVFVRRFAS